MAPLAVLGIGAATAVFGTSSLGTFYVESAVANGISPGTAGSMLAVGAATGIAARIGWGAVGGRWRKSHVPLLTGLLVGGSVGYLLVGGATTGPALALTTVLLFATSWGWPALLLYAIVVRTEPAPAAATGVTAAGLYAGGIVGPVVFGSLVEGPGYDAAWLFVAAANVVAGLFMLAGGRWLDRVGNSEGEAI